MQPNPLNPTIEKSENFRTTPSLLLLMRGPVSQSPALAAIVVANVMVFMAMLVAGSGLWHSTTGVPLAWGANFGPATQDGQWWRLLSAMFVHFGVLHLGMNMWALWDIGRLMERLYGSVRLAALYMICGVSGNLLSLVTHGNDSVSGGASGAVFGLYGALLGFLWRERSQIEQVEYRWLFGATLLFTSLMLAMGMVVPGIDNAAHGGGLATGVLAGTLLGHPWTESSQIVKGKGLVAVSLALGIAALIWKLPDPVYRMSEEIKAQTAIHEFLNDERQINQQWQGLLSNNANRAVSFEDLAGGVDQKIVAGYEHSFERLIDATPNSRAPSAERLAQLQTYARLRAEAAKGLAEGLRAQDTQKMRLAIQKAKEAASAVAPPAASLQKPAP